MSTHSTNQLESKVAASKDAKNKRQLELKVVSFGYKAGPPPLANVVFDVRFLKNPFWVEELRPLTGLDKPVQDYVLHQPLAQDFLQSMLSMFEKILPQVAEHNKVEQYIIALGCTGGQHRSTTLVEALAKGLSEKFPQFSVVINHRELQHHSSSSCCAEDANK